MAFCASIQKNECIPELTPRKQSLLKKDLEDTYAHPDPTEKKQQ